MSSQNLNKNFNFTSYTNLSFPFDLACHELTTEYKAVIIRTTELSTVTLFDADYISSNDGTLVIPTNKLSNKYLVSTIEWKHLGSDYKSQFAIGVLHNDTQLDIQFNIKNNKTITIQGHTFSSGEIYSHTFGELQTFQVSHIRDLTGTYIKTFLSHPAVTWSLSYHQLTSLITSTLSRHFTVIQELLYKC